MTTLGEIGDAQYMALQTFRKSGVGVNTPVWVAREDGKLYVMTDASTWKVKRIRNNSRVEIAASDARGNPQSEWLEAEARILTDDAAWQRMKARIQAKYGLIGRAFLLWGRLRGSDYVVLEIS